MDFNINAIISKSIVALETEKGIVNMWKAPLAAAISADHPLIPELRQAASKEHLLPKELLSDAKSIIVFFIPFENRIIESNKKGEAASEEWARAYIFTNELLARINDEIEKCLDRQGFKVSKINATHNFDEKTLISHWSHRHIAWMAGLGSFGINNMLITANGCCGRFGSIVTNADTGELGFGVSTVSPSVEKCLYKINGSCGVCRAKCAVNALREDGVFDRAKCYEVCLKNAELYKSIGLADVCGKCLVGLPCSSKDPAVLPAVNP